MPSGVASRNGETDAAMLRTDVVDATHKITYLSPASSPCGPTSDPAVSGSLRYDEDEVEYIAAHPWLPVTNDLTSP